MTDEAIGNDPAETVQDSLKANWDKMAEDTPDEPTEETPDETPEKPVDETEEDNPDDAPKDESADETEDEPVDESEDESEEDTEGLVSPEHWSKKDREMFDGLDDDAKEFINRRYSSMEKDYNGKTQSIAREKRFNDDIKEMLSPYRQDFELNGVDDIGAIKQLVAAHDFLQRDPKGAIKWLAESYNVEMDMEDEYEDEDSPQISALQKQISALESKLTQQESSANQQTMEEMNREIQTFKDAKNDSGLEHPYFEDVYADMVDLVRAGTAKDLQSAYEKAVWTNPDTRKKMMAEIESSESKKRIKETNEKTNKAKRAAKVNRKGSGTPQDDKGRELSLRETLRKNYKDAASK